MNNKRKPVNPSKLSLGINHPGIHALFTDNFKQIVFGDLIKGLI